MKVYINAAGPDQVGGYFTYITNLVHHLAIFDKKNTYVVRCNGRIYETLKNLSKNFIVLNSPSYHNISMVRFFWMQFILPFILLSNRTDILFSPLNATPYLLKFSKIKSVLVIHSNIPWINSKYLPYGLFKAGLLKFLKNFSLKCSDKIICVSDFAKNELIKHAYINANKVHAIHLGVNKPALTTTLKTMKNYFLYVANSALHHNHINLLIAYNLLLKNNITEYDLLLIVDPVDRVQYENIRRKIYEMEISSKVQIITPKETTELFRIYCSASMYIFPSLSETFGMTTLEAMSCGVPVLCSNMSAMPEVNGDAVVHFDPLNPEDIADKIKLVLEDTDLYNSLVKKGYERIQNYTWQNTARKTFYLFEALTAV